MAHVFISYAREDQDFVHRVFDSLKEFGRETWVDWEGIPPSAVWMAEVRKAIESGEAFVFVITPASLASSVCREEVAHAASVNKRLIPILHRDVGDTPAPEAVAERNWIFLRQEDDFERGMERLLGALAADPEWLEQHTRLLVRAREWEQRHRPNSLLLRGEDLQDAERWLASASGKEPGPTPLHAEFVIASRRAVGRRQRLTLAAVGSALVVSVVLSALALVQRSAAVRERERAEQEARTSRSRELAAEGLGQLEVDPELGVLLSLEAVEAAPTEEAEAALRETLGGSHLRATLEGHEGSVLDVVPSPDGATVLSVGFDGTARLWDAASGTELHVLEGHEGPLTAAAFSPNGSLVATAGEDGTARLWDTASGDELHVLQGHEGELTSIAFAPDGHKVLTGSRDGTARVWRVDDGSTLATLAGHDGAVTCVAAGPEGAIATGGADGSVRLWHPSGDASAILLGHRDEVTSVTLGPRDIVLSTSEDATARVWSLPDGDLRALLEGHGNDVVAGAIAPDGRHVATAALDGTARVWLVATGRQTAAMVEHDGQAVVDVGFEDGGARVVTAGDDGTARIWSAVTGEQLSVLRGHTDDVLAAAFGIGRGQVVTGSGDGTARIWDATGRTLAIFAGHEDWVWNAAFDGPEERVITASRDGTARVWDAGSGEQLQLLEVSRETVYSASVLHDGERAITIGQDGIPRVWDIETESLLLELRGHDAPVGGVDITDDDLRAITGSDDGTARLWDLQTGEQLAVLPHGPPTVVWVFPSIFSPDGSVVITGTQQTDSTVRIWDVGGIEPRLLHELKGHTPGIRAIAVSADGNRLLTAGTDLVPRIWDPTTGELLVTLEGHAAAILGADLSDDGRRVVTISEDATARIWDARTGEELHALRLTAEVSYVDISADGELVVAGDANGVAHVWSTRTGAEVGTFTGHTGFVGAIFDADGDRVLTWSDDTTSRLFSCELCGSMPDLLAIADERVTRELTAEERAEFDL